MMGMQSGEGEFMCETNSLNWYKKGFVCHYNALPNRSFLLLSIFAQFEDHTQSSDRLLSPRNFVLLTSVVFMGQILPLQTAVDQLKLNYGNICSAHCR